MQIPDGRAWLAGAGLVAIGVDLADPVIAIAIAAVILRITWQSWEMVRSGHAH